MLMYTSCGWFFDELSGHRDRPSYSLRRARHAPGGRPLRRVLEPHFLELLAKAKSNLPEYGTGAQIYEKCVRPAVIDIQRVAAHYAISSLFETYPDQTRIYCYEAERQDYSLEAEGKMRLGVGAAPLPFCDDMGVCGSQLWRAALRRSQPDGGYSPLQDSSDQDEQS